MKYEEFLYRISAGPSVDRRALYDEMTKPMGVEEIVTFLFEHDYTISNHMAEVIKPLTRQQGFVVDWSSKPNAIGWRPYWIIPSFSRDCEVLGEPISDTIPRPTPKYREMTWTEKTAAINETFRTPEQTDAIMKILELPTKIEVRG